MLYITIFTYFYYFYYHVIQHIDSSKDSKIASLDSSWTIFYLTSQVTNTPLDRWNSLKIIQANLSFWGAVFLLKNKTRKTSMPQFRPQKEKLDHQWIISVIWHRPYPPKLPWPLEICFKTIQCCYSQLILLVLVKGAYHPLQNNIVSEWYILPLGWSYATYHLSLDPGVNYVVS